MICDVYLNLNNGKISLMGTRKPHTGKVVCHADAVLLTDVTFRVRPGGHRKAVETGVRNVHAFARGEVNTNINTSDLMCSTRWERVRYNPFIQGWFFRECDGARIDACAAALIVGHKLYITDQIESVCEKAGISNVGI